MMNEAGTDKKQLRRHIRDLAAVASEDSKQEWSRLLCQQIYDNPKVREADILVLFSPLPDEVDIMPLVDTLHEQGRVVLLPRVTGDIEMELYRYHGPESLAMGAFGIMEPIASSDHLVTLTPSSGSVIAIIPGVGFDVSGNRLGRGRGYYDHFLSHHPYIYKIGVCHPYQYLLKIPHAPHDVSMNEVVTVNLG